MSLAGMSVRVWSHARLAEEEINGKIDEAFKKAAFDIEAKAKEKAPVDTGALMNAIAAEGEGHDWIVVSPAEYSIYQELGTRFMAARPFLVPALEEVAPSLRFALGRVE